MKWVQICFYVVDYSTGMRFSKCLNRCMHIVRMCTTDQCAPGIILAVENIFIFNVKLYKLSIIDGFIYSYHCFICFGFLFKLVLINFTFVNNIRYRNVMLIVSLGVCLYVFFPHWFYLFIIIFCDKFKKM